MHRIQTQPVRIGIAGCGLFGESHLQAFRAVPDAAVVALYDPVKERAEDLARQFGVGRVCSSLAELCGVDDVDAIDVVAPEEVHHQIALAAIEAGKDLFIEKPFALDLGHCGEIIGAAERAGRILMVGHIVRFETKYAMIKEQVASGRLGKVVSMHARRNRLKTLVPKYGHVHPAIENAIHDIDLMLWYTGQRVYRVRGYSRNAGGAPHADTFWGVLEFEGGALGVVETIWLLPKPSGIMLDDAFQLVGDSGVANLSFVPGGISFWREDGFEIPDISYDPRVRGAAFGALRDELSYFCECVQERRAPAVITATEAKNAVRVAQALLESSDADRDVVIRDWN